MAPPPEYDKEPKAPDKSVSNTNCEDFKIHSITNDQQTNSDNKTAITGANVEPEDKNVETLDDGQLRALLDEAITYKCPKDREGKSSLFKELLEEVEQDEQACEAAARTWGAGRAGRAVRAAGGAGGRRRALPHSNSLQDLVAAALAAEPHPRRRHHHRDQVSARTHHGGSLPSGVDTTFLLSEEPARGGGGVGGGVEYVATVRCENPTPLGERRVSASDAHAHQAGDNDNRDRRSKMAAFPMTYTARATLEIGSGSVGSGRAVTTTTASNQVRPTRTPHPAPHHTRWRPLESRPPTRGPPERMFSELHAPVKRRPDRNQQKLLSALKSKANGGGTVPDVPRGPDTGDDRRYEQAPAKAQGRTSNKKNMNFQGVVKIPVTVANAIANCVNHSAKPKKQKASQATANPKQALLNNTTSHDQPKKVGSKTRIQVVNKTPNRSENVPLNFKEYPNKIWHPPEESPTRLLNWNTVQNTSHSSRNTARKGNHANQSPVLILPQSSFDRTSKYYRYSEYNYDEVDTRTRGPPEAIFERKTTKSRLRQRCYSSPVDYEFLQQFCDSSAFQVTDPIIFPRNNACGRSYTSNEYPPEMNAHLYSKNKRCDSKVHDKTKKPKSFRHSANTSPLQNGWNQYLAPLEVEQTMDKDVVFDNRINPRNVKFMTIGAPHSSITVTDNRDSVDDESIVGDNAIKDKDYESDCQAFTAPDRNATSADSICANIKQKDVVISHLQEHNGPGNDSSTVSSPNDAEKNLTNPMKTDPVIWAINEIDTKTTDLLEHVDEVNIKCKLDAAPDIQVLKGLVFEKNKSVLVKEEVSYCKEILDLNKGIDNVENVKWTVKEIDSKLHHRFDNSEDTISDSNSVDLKKSSHTSEDAEEIIKDDKFKDQKENVLNKKPNTDLSEDGDDFRDECNVIVETVKGIETVDINDNDVNESQDNTQRMSLDDFKPFVPFETNLPERIIKCYEMTTIKATERTEHKIKDEADDCIELVNIPYTHINKTEQQDNVKYFSDQVKLFETLEYFGNPISGNDNERTVLHKIQAGDDSPNESCEISNKESLTVVVPENKEDCRSRDYKTVNSSDNIEDMKLAHINSNSSFGVSSGEQYVLAELSNNAYIFLTLPKRFLTTNNSNGNSVTDKIREISNDNTCKEIRETHSQSSDQYSSRQSLRKLLFEKLLRDGVPGNRLQMPSATDEVDSGIPFSCITSPEVVTSCNTTSSSQASISTEQKPRAVVSGYGGLPLSRPANYGATAVTAVNEYKKSLDENGNSVPGASSPQSASSQNKKARKKKTSKNETVITSDQINGYQGNKDLKEVLRFIESNEEHGRGKLGRVHAKHKEEEDKGKKRSADRRRDTKHLPPRASSLDERSRTSLRGLSARAAAAAGPAAGAAERRSWGDDALYYSEPPAAPAHPPALPAAAGKKKGKPPPPPDTDVAAELLDFQTVTKKKKQRKRFEEASAAGAGDLYRAAGRASPERRRKSAPPSDKSNDSNDDMDSVHSLPAGAAPAAPAPAAPAAVSYADIARTRNTLNNIPDLIESCNYYAEEPPPPPPPPAAVSAAPAIDADSYPALARARAPRKPAAPAPAQAPAAAPDVVAGGGGGGGGRPAVVLLAAAGGAELDGVTFGFDVNEQLLAARRCDLVLGAARGDAGLRYVPPAPLPPLYMDHLAAIVDYVGHAWEDIVKCGGGGGKVRYFSE